MYTKRLLLLTSESKEIYYRLCSHIIEEDYELNVL